ncbi:arginine synthesis PII-interacting regulator PirA [Umezakia ovalisporum]|jgi:hypothetical protein|uniref:arginine synthesis PII-interacting regulator PirA n=1 Tax=Umezakia ovalisporum TaxID=75695 RepID=UPI000B188F83|nr:hypothetical protein [Umezakia ovalisporum]MDH6084380.1 hypothetical protein [Umezakia ovalisporum TAC611]MDH6089828.1 hypothetical protein [Umezakia ovalisporum Ak1311]
MSQNRLSAINQAQKAHRMSIQKSLEHRLQVAKASGDSKLIDQLEAEIKYFS